MSRATSLIWVERLLIVAGVILAGWSIVRLTEARFFSTIPAPAPPIAGRSLPGDAGNPPSITRRAHAGDWLAKLDAPSVHLSSAVLEGTDDATLAKGAGHIEDTPFPGDRGNVGIAGHRDTTFRAVRNLNVGDPLILTTPGRVITYRITDFRIVDPEEVSVLDPTDQPSITLVTCYPFTYIGHAPKRYIVRAMLVDDQQR